MRFNAKVSSQLYVACEVIAMYDRRRKPQLAEDAVIEKVNFPCLVQPKIDGVRALNLTGTLTGRSMDPFVGYGITACFSRPEYAGFDGEMTLGRIANSTDRLCSRTTGAMGRFKGVDEMADLHWWVFDLVTEDTVGLPYSERYALLTDKVARLNHPRIHLVPVAKCHDESALRGLIAKHSEDGYEGTIIRNPEAFYKEGRATKKTQELWRVKPWGDAEILVTGITEGEVNGNEAKKNTLGRTERSSAKAGMVPNGQVGSIQGVMLADFIEKPTGAILFAKGLTVTVGSGEMSAEEAAHYFQNPDKIVGHIVKFKHMTHGVKNLPRFPTYISHRIPQDVLAEDTNTCDAAAMAKAVAEFIKGQA